ncbi:hypothetical protein HK102_000178 [Quaeritorhiza haematococci]|nr:hypothetical protein HK102_000178 [Quaeritorhiza haematococci]
MALRRSFSGSQNPKRSDAYTSKTVYTSSDGFRILSIKGTNGSIKEAISRVLYLVLESNPTRDFLKSAEATLRSLSFSAPDPRRDISNGTISVNFVVPGGTQLEELKKRLFVMMEKDGFDTHGLLLEKSTSKCELRGVPAELFVVRGHGKVVVKLLFNMSSMTAESLNCVPIP